MSLADLQRAFQAHILDGDTAVVNAVQPHGKRGLPVYHHAYRATLQDALRDTYARTALWLGEEAFAAAVDRTVAVVRSSSWTLADYGVGFADELARALPHDPEVAELAWLEHAMRRAFTAAPMSPADASIWTDVDWEVARLRLAPSLAWRRIETDLPEIWHAIGEERPAERILLDADAGIVVWRDGLMPRFRVTDVIEIEALEALSQDTSFAAMCAQLATRSAGSESIGAMLSRWIADELVAV